MILVWGVRGEASPGDADKVERAKRFLTYLDQATEKVLVPAICAAEYLTGVPRERQPEALEELSRRFRIAPFDIKVAAIAADLWQEKNGGRRLSDHLRASYGNASRAKIKADCYVVAAALAHGATIIYSDDPDVARWGDGRIKVYPLPDIPVQESLFG